MSVSSHRWILGLLLLVAPTVWADDYAEARAELVAAYQAQDYPAMVSAAGKALVARPGYPGAKFNLAFAQALNGNAHAALDTLTELADAGVDFGAGDLAEFESLKALPGWTTYGARIEELNQPAGTAEVAFEHDDADFIPEGIVIDGQGQAYLGSIRHGTIIRIGDYTEVVSDGAVHWSVFGMRLDGRGGLWFASASVPEYGGRRRDEGRTGLFRLNLESGEIDVRALLPEAGEPQVLGDLVILDEDRILATESLTGRLFSYSVSADEFMELVPARRLRSMQGLVLDESGEFLYVADYVGGLFRVRLADSHLEQVTAENSVNLYGIDGLYRHGDTLIAIQNGSRPHRVSRLVLSKDGLRITDVEVLASSLPAFDEPTLGTVVGDAFYFVANSHWNRFDGNGNLPEDLEGPVILKIDL